MERVSELVRLRRLLALPSPAVLSDPMATERVARQAGEQVVEDLLADAPAPARRQLESLAAAGQVAGSLQLAGQLVEGFEVAGGLRPQQLSRRVVVQAGEVAGLLDRRELVLEGIESLELADPIERRLEPEGLLAAELVALAEAVGHQLVHVRREAGE